MRLANLICSRFCFLVFLCTVRHCCVAVEQPISSCLKYIPYFSFLHKVLLQCPLAASPWCHVSFWMGLYGARAPKPSYLMGSGFLCSHFSVLQLVAERMVCIAGFACKLRRWIQSIRNRMTKLKKKEFTHVVVKKKRRPDGSIAVPEP